MQSRQAKKPSNAPEPGMFQERSFAVQGKMQEKSQQPDLKTSLMRAERYGHHLHRIKSKVSAATAVQPNMVRGSSLHSSSISSPQAIQPAFRSPLGNQPTPNFSPITLPKVTPVMAQGGLLGELHQENPRLFPTTKSNPNDLVAAFNPGDKLYGLSQQRPQSAVKPNAGGMATVIDQLNNQFLGTGGMGFFNRLNDPPNSAVIQDWEKMATYGKPNPSSHVLTPEAQKYQQWLEAHPKYSPTKTVVGDEPLSSPYRQWDRVKKSCKAGIQYTVDSGNKVHFILDGIDQNAVVNKHNYQTQQPEVKVNPITGDSQQNITASELRFIHRNWKNPQFHSGVEFWQGGKKVAAPWVQNPQLWMQYSPKSLQARQ